MFCWLFKKKSITMHGNMNVKFTKESIHKSQHSIYDTSKFTDHSLSHTVMVLSDNKHS